ncbi:Imm45 family immunity protein [Variovorax sp. E3]|uniref:Imm45 family immunity protein n=1 Tax=Variovorax sp. E3 TaxID=1914993 RepID=UPI0018DC77E9|nr:Imm45 family immunity protein [Variovorax sp. E3]
MEFWKKLNDYSNEYVKCGAVLRVPSVEKNRENWYREDIVDLMVFYAGAAFKDAACGLICISGHKAGRINATFPLESGDGNGNGLRRDWLISNWNRWVYMEGDINDVWIRDPEPVQSMPSVFLEKRD